MKNVPVGHDPDPIILSFVGVIILIMWFMFLFEPYIVGGCH